MEDTNQPVTFSIGSLPIHGDLLLAPMDGYTDSPFRQLCRSLGSAASYTEFITAQDAVYGNPHLKYRIAYEEPERPLIYQLLDNKPDLLVKAAQFLLARKPDAIDLNMGCSARQVAGRGAGAGLLKSPRLVAEIVQKLRAAIPIPFTAKIRLGWDDQSRNYLEIVHILEDSGVDAIAVHGRTRAQAYTGMADWDAIAEIRQSVRIPVIANGDVVRVEDIERIKCHTGCPAVMIGRAAIKNPWIFARLNREEVPMETLRATIATHLGNMQAFYGEQAGLILFRKFVSAYLNTPGMPPEIRHPLLMAENTTQFFEQLDCVLEHVRASGL